MKIRLPIPRAVRRAWDVFGDWANEPLVGRVLRIDLLIVAFGVLATLTGYWHDGWRGAAQSGVGFVFVLMCVQLLRRD